jgi:oxygen-dependent protoporphyrinogen oxidase
MKPVAIVGGGITGLTAAYTLHKHDIPFVLYEASPRLGGLLLTERLHGVTIEGGADSWITAKTWAADLARELGIGDQLIHSNDAERATYIVRGGRLVSMPKGLRLFVPMDLDAAERSGLFSTETMQRIRREVDLSPRASDTDESVAAFAERHFGREMVAALVDPLLAGVYGVNASVLSAHAVIPQMVEAERTNGSLIKTLQAGPPITEPIFTTFRHGISTLVDALIGKISEDSIRLNTAVQSVERAGAGWRVNGEDASAVILAISPLQVASLDCVRGELSDLLAQFTYGDALTIALIYDRAAISNLPGGFGALVPRSEGREMIACTFVHQKWPERMPHDVGMVRVFFTQRIFLTDAEIQAVAERELREVLGINAKPKFAMVHRWPQSMPQYTVGHMERMKKVTRLSREAGLHLAGNAYRGIGVSDCVRDGHAAAAAVIAQLRPLPSR